MPWRGSTGDLQAFPTAVREIGYRYPQLRQARTSALLAEPVRRATMQAMASNRKPATLNAPPAARVAMNPRGDLPDSRSVRTWSPTRERAESNAWRKE